MSRHKKKNPSPLTTGALVVGGIVALVVGAKVVEKRDEARRKKSKAEKKDEISPLSGTYAEGATFGASSKTVEEVALPVVFNKANLSTLYRRTPEGNIVDVWANTDEMPVVETSVLEQLVTNMTGEATYKAWTIMLHLVANKGYDLENPQMRDQAVQEVLSALTPKMDWTKGLQPYTADSPPFYLWTGVELVGATAYQSYWNKQALEIGDVVSTGFTDQGIKWQVVYTGNNAQNMPQYLAQVFVPEGEPIPGFGQPGDWSDLDVYVMLEDAVGAAKAAAQAQAA